ncbi:MAG: Crp/Fnr family transcriptional regulator, partial [Spirochaetota bacterium]
METEANPVQHGDGEKRALLERVIPFRFLNEQERNTLLPHMERCSYAAGDIIIEQGLTDTWVYLLGGGTASIQSPRELDKRSRLPRVISTVDAGHYFGEWESVFDCPRTYDVVSMTDTWAYRIPGEVMLDLLKASSTFAQGLGTLLRDRQGIFAAFERFKAQLFRDVTNGYLVVRRLLPLYESLEPALHAGASNPTKIDVAGLLYAVRRLPDNITRTFALLLTDNLVGAYRNPNEYFIQVKSSARRREVWEMVPGKDLVLLRNGVSDLIDFVTCLCTYAVEAKKIRKRLSASDCLEALSNYLSNDDPPPVGVFLTDLPFST